MHCMAFGPAHEAVAITLCKRLRLSRDDVFARVREFRNQGVSRSGLVPWTHRYRVGDLQDMKAKAPKPKHSVFNAHEPGDVRTDVKYLVRLQDETRHGGHFLAIDRASRWVVICV